ncbi:MAG: 50S ribosomal protein L25 [Chlamydiota bacterium]
MKLSLFPRLDRKKSALTKIRAEKNIPAVIYGAIKNQPVFVQGAAFSALLRQIPENHLSNTIFTIEYDGSEYKALVKGIEYNKTTYEVLHLDFMIPKDKPVNVKIPIVCNGVIDCVGIKLGGSLRRLIRSFPVQCTMENIPSFLEVDVREMQVGDAKRLRDIALPPEVRPLLNLNEVAVTIAKQRS